MMRAMPGESSRGAGRPHLVSALFSSLRGYRPRWAGADALAAVTLLVIAVPEQLATSRLAGTPPVAGLYAFVAGTTLFAMFGSNPRMSVGADSTIAPLFAVAIGHLAVSGSARYLDLLGILAVTVGVLVALVAVLRLGWIAEFLSEPIIYGFLAGVAVIIVVHQLPDLLGVPGVEGSTVHRIGVIASRLPEVNGWSLGIGLVVLGLVVGAERIDRRLPGALVGLIGSTAAVAALGLRAHGVDVLGSFAHGAPRFGLRGLSWSAIQSVLPVAGVVSLVVISQSAATTRAFSGAGEDGGVGEESGAGAAGSHAVDINRDFLGVGAGSIAAGLAGSFPVNASPPRTAAVAAAHGRTQAAGLGAAAAVVLLIPAAGLLKDVPVATLAAVLLFVAARIFPLRELRSVGHFDRIEFGLAVVTLLTVAFVGVEQGIGVAVGLAILDRTRLSARPQLHVLGRIPGTTSWAPLSGAGQAAPVPEILVVLFATPLWYANAAHFQSQLDAVLAGTTGRTRAVVLDAMGMSDIDYTGARSLGRVLEELDRRHIAFAVARAGEHARESLARAGLAEDIGEDHFFGSVNEAVTAMRPEQA
jgi:SulP family sulfate permease